MSPLIGRNKCGLASELLGTGDWLTPHAAARYYGVTAAELIRDRSIRRVGIGRTLQLFFCPRGAA